MSILEARVIRPGDASENRGYVLSPVLRTALAQAQNVDRRDAIRFTGGRLVVVAAWPGPSKDQILAAMAWQTYGLSSRMFAPDAAAKYDRECLT